MLSLAAGVLPEFDPPAVIEAAATAGWEAVGIWYDHDTWTDARTREVRQRLDDTGVTPLDMEPIFVTPDGDWGAPLIAAAAEIGASNILTVGFGVEVEPFAERFAELCDLAAPAGITVNVEFGRIFAVKSLAQAQEVLARADRVNAGILLDNIHVDRAGNTAAEVAAIDPMQISYAQVCDAPSAPRDSSRSGLRTDAVDDRCNLGEGGLRWQEFIDALPSGTPMSLEVRSAALRAGFSDPSERAAEVLRATNLALG